MRADRHISITLQILGLTLAGLLLTTAPALATNYGYKEVAQFGTDGTQLESTPFSEPESVAVDNTCAVSKLSGPECAAFDPSNEEVYVADRGAQTVSKFSPTGEPISSLSLPEGTIPASVAVDPTSGDVYVLDSANNTVEKFYSDGEQVAGFALTGPTLQGNVEVAVAGIHDGDLYVACSAGGPIVHDAAVGASGGIEDKESGVVDQFTSSGAYVAQITSERFLEFPSSSTEPARFYPFIPNDVAVDSTGSVYVTSDNLDLSGVEKYSLTGGIWVFDGVVDQGKIDASRVVADPVVGDLYVTGGFEGGTSRGHYDDLEWYGSSGTRLYEFGATNGFGPGSAFTSGVAVNSLTGAVYVSNDRGARVDIFERVELHPPTVTSQPVTSVFAESAVLNGTTNPEGLSTTYHFEYWTTDSPEPIGLSPFDGGSGFETNTHTEVLSGLAPDTTYHAALVASNAEGTITGEEQTFTTAALPTPEASTGGAGEITPYSATIAGTLNPNGIETSYHFDIGADTNYGAQIYGSGIFAGVTPITQTLQNLQPGTTYHYRFVASNEAGTVYGADQTFTTTAIPQAISLPVALPFIGYPSIAFPEEVKAGAKKPVMRCKKGFVEKKGKCVRKPKAKGKKKIKGK